jgi:hypothetical protein
MHKAGHAKTIDCEAQAPEYATTLDTRLAKLERVVATQAAQIASLQMSMPRGIPG